MFSTFSRKQKTTNIKKRKVTVNKSMKDYSKEDFFVKKAEAARELLAKYGYPKELITK
ncbi:hypothetical protein SAMN05518672_101503 [Chitinophaga sp. CF118]|uniref:hypothetical protein n=1 Tax=Chitinophaga sp. CF118 TaxID=1884367 RepID=UPI0008E3DA3D|nr:hypothetical protein [Chitinophaga sp. CF118]SFD10633.1 hypothetical protein SAMN05518672_101503 [Chitinophaga sp. CF118]